MTGWDPTRVKVLDIHQPIVDVPNLTYELSGPTTTYNSTPWPNPEQEGLRRPNHPSGHRNVVVSEQCSYCTSESTETGSGRDVKRCTRDARDAHRRRPRALCGARAVRILCVSHDT
jgi:hypothetical protein